MSVATDNFNDAADRAKHDAASSGFATDVDGLKKSFSQLRTDLTQLVERAFAAGKHGVAAGRDKAGDAVDGIKDMAAGIKDKGVDSVKSVEQKITEHAIASTVIAFCAGYVLGKLFSRR